MTAQLNAHDDHAQYAASHYGTYVGRVGALAVALGIGAAIATGHGLGLGVAYATEGDPGTDTSQDGDTNDNEDGTGATPPAPPAAAVAPGSSNQPRSPLARIANVPRMIFNATGGAQRSSADRTQSRLPRLSNVLEDVASAVTNNLPKLPESANGSAPQASTGGTSAPPATSRSSFEPAGRNLAPTVTSLPSSVANEFKTLVNLPTRALTQPARTITPGNSAPAGIQRQALVDNGQQDVVQPSVALVQTPTSAPPPINPVGVVTRLMTVAFAAVVAPGPAAPTDPPLLLGVLAWARREIQLNFFNRTPNAIPDVKTATEDPVTPVSGNVLTNDRLQNPDGPNETLTVTDARTQTTDKGTLVLNADGSYTYTPKPNANGTDTFTYTVSDEASRPHIHGLSGLLYGGGHTDTATLTINITPVNDAPTVPAPIPDQSTNEDAPYTYTIPTSTFNDVDGDALTYNATGLPAGLTYDAATRTISGTPTNADVGTHTITVTATDTSGASVTDSFALKVVNTNDAPTVAAPIPDQTTNEDAAYNYQIPTGTFNDVDAGDTLSYTTSTLPSWLTFDPATRTFTGTPANANVGDTTITVTATDAAGATVDDTFTLTVVNTNDAPTVAAPIPDQSTNEDAPFSYTIPAGTFDDVDAGDTLSYSATGLPPGLTFDPTTRIISGTPTTPGNYSITVTATDLSGATAEDTFALSVVDVSDAGGFEGKTVRYAYLYPTVSTTYGLVTPQDVTVGSGVEIPSFSPVDTDSSIDLSGDRILVTYGDSVSWNPSSFNGFRISDTNGTVNDIVGVTVLQNGGNAGLDASRVTFDANNVYVNWQGLSFQTGDVVEIGVLFA